jgi:hypothetical protein
VSPRKPRQPDDREVFRALGVLEDAAIYHTAPIPLRPVLYALQTLIGLTSIREPFVDFWMATQRQPHGRSNAAIASLDRIRAIVNVKPEKSENSKVG